MIAPVFTINGAAFDPDVVNTTVKLGTTEEWILRNTSPDAHPFHIHVEDFQVMSINGDPQPFSLSGHREPAAAQQRRHPDPLPRFHRQVSTTATSWPTRISA